jgi:hypothetical protein
MSREISREISREQGAVIKNLGLWQAVLRSPFVKASLLAFFVLAVFNWPQRNDPPYWDGVIGAYQQGIWLSRNGMSYSELLAQPDLYHGGPKVSVTSGLAFIYGNGLRIASPQSLILIFHILTWGLAALALGLAFQLLREIGDIWTSAGWLAVAALDPIFSAQTGAIYQEIPLACCAMLVIVFCHRGWYPLAAATCILGAFIKPTMTVFALALLVWLIFGRLAIRLGGLAEIFQKRSFFLSLPILVLGASYPMIGGLPQVEKSLALRLSDWYAMMKQEFPYQALVLLLTFLSCATILLWSSRRRRFTSSAARFGLVSLLAISVWGFWLAHLLHHFPLCRYLAVVTIPTTTLLGLCCQELLSRRWQFFLIALLIAVYSANQYGALLPALPPDYGRSGRMLERSRESLQDIADQRELCRAIEENWPNEPILVKYPTIQMLGLPEMGYVHSTLQVVPVGAAAHGVTERRVFEDELPQAQWRRALVIYSPHCYEASHSPSLVPLPGDEILWLRTLKGAPLLLYRRNRP